MADATIPEKRILICSSCGRPPTENYGWPEGPKPGDTCHVCYNGHFEEYRLVKTWQPIATAPRDGTPILACSRRGENTSDSWFIAWWGGSEINAFVEISTAKRRWGATHWMPLPKLPE